MLETIREYAAERLADAARRSSPPSAIATPTAYLELARGGRGHPRLRRPAATVLDRLEDDHDNLRTALVHAIETADCQQAAALLRALFRFWHMRGHLVEGRARTDAVLAMPAWTDAPSLSRLRALEVAGGLAYWSGDIPGASVHYEAAEREARGLGDDAEIANALYNRAFAPSANRECRGLVASRRRTRGCRWPTRRSRSTSGWATRGGIARCLWVVGMGSLYGEDLVSALPALTRAIEAFEPLDDAFGLAWARFTRGVTNEGLGIRALPSLTTRSRSPRSRRPTTCPG